MESWFAAFAIVGSMPSEGGSESIDGDCGRSSAFIARAVAMDARFHGDRNDLGPCRSLHEIQQALERQGLVTFAVQWNERRLPATKTGVPVILRLNGPYVSGKEDGHFVVVVRNHKGWRIIDYPALLRNAVDPERLAKRWDGSCLYVGETEEDLADVRALLNSGSTRWPYWLVGLAGLAVFVAAVAPLLRRACCVLKMRGRLAPRRGATLLELLVVFGVLLILAGVTLPAVQAARESVRRVQCLSRLSNLVAASQQYESAYRVFPKSWWQFDNGSRSLRTYSGHVMLLPYIGAHDVWDRLNLATYQDLAESSPENASIVQRRIAAFLCPSGAPPRGWPGCAFRLNSGSLPDLASATGTFDAVLPTRAGSFSDGLARTAAVAEGVHGSGGPFDPNRDAMFLPTELSSPPDWPSAEEWVHYCSRLRDGAKFDFNQGRWWHIGAGTTTMYNHAVGPNSKTVTCGRYRIVPDVGLFPARSAHSGGVHAAFMDGSARFISNDVALDVWRAAGTRAGLESVGSL